jgi:predicted phage tail protein
MVTIRLLGEVGRKFGRRFQLAVKTPAEALRALCVQIPELRQYLLESGENGIDWRVVTDHAMGLEEEQLLWPMSKRMVLAPIPAGRGATGRIIAGVALVALSIIFAPAIGGFLGLGAGAVTSGTAGTLAAITNVTGFLGLSLIFGGVAELLTPTPKMPNVGGAVGGGPTSGRSREEQLKSFTFDKSNANTLQGEVVPVLYGERIIGALPVLSFGLELQNFL